MARYQKRGRTTYGKKFRTRKGKYGSYKYVSGRRVGFVTSSVKRSRNYSSRKNSYGRRRY